MALPHATVNHHSVNLTRLETSAMEEVQQPHSFTNNRSNSKSYSNTVGLHPHQRLLRPRKNPFPQLRRTSSGMDRYRLEQWAAEEEEDQVQDVAMGSSNFAGMTAALERTVAPLALERHRRKFLEYWDFG